MTRLKTKKRSPGHKKHEQTQRKKCLCDRARTSNRLVGSRARDGFVHLFVTFRVFCGQVFSLYESCGLQMNHAARCHAFVGTAA